MDGFAMAGNGLGMAGWWLRLKVILWLCFLFILSNLYNFMEHLWINDIYLPSRGDLDKKKIHKREKKSIYKHLMVVSFKNG